MITNPPLPELKSVPVAQSEHEHIRYCTWCQKPTVHVEDQWDGAYVKSVQVCQVCGNAKRVVNSGKQIPNPIDKPPQSVV